MDMPWVTVTEFGPSSARSVQLWRRSVRNRPRQCPLYVHGAHRSPTKRRPFADHSGAVLS
jgi:hypothetical protein